MPSCGSNPAPTDPNKSFDYQDQSPVKCLLERLIEMNGSLNTLTDTTERPKLEKEPVFQKRPHSLTGEDGFFYSLVNENIDVNISTHVPVSIIALRLQQMKTVSSWAQLSSPRTVHYMIRLTDVSRRSRYNVKKTLPVCSFLRHQGWSTCHKSIVLQFIRSYNQ